MFDQMTSKALPNATFSRASQSGPTLSEKLAGQTRDLFGPEVALANLSARQAKDLRLLTSGTYGPPSTTSSKSAALQQSLESKLRAKTQTLGSTLYKLTWKPWVTPSGRSRSRLRASALRTSGIEPTGAASLASARPTPTTRDWKDGAECANVPLNSLLGRVAWLTGWPTPMARDHFPAHKPEYIAAKVAQGHGMANLNDRVQLAGWPTPMAGTPAQNGNNAAGNNDSSRKTIALAGWPTPTAALADKGVRSTEGAIREAMRNHGPDLAAMASLTLNGPARQTASGEMLTGLDAQMGSGGQLSPAMSRWLMALPAVWDECAPMPSKKSRVK